MRAVAVAADITEGHLGNIENDRNDCSTSIAKRIAEVLGVTLDELLSEPNDTAISPSPTATVSGSDDAPINEGEHTAADKGIL